MHGMGGVQFHSWSHLRRLGKTEIGSVAADNTLLGSDCFQSIPAVRFELMNSRCSAKTGHSVNVCHKNDAPDVLEDYQGLTGPYVID
jgi:hypothetical protein